MKKQLLMKTFLVAVCLLGGANFAWADTPIGNVDEGWTDNKVEFTLPADKTLSLNFVVDKTKNEQNYQGWVTQVLHGSDMIFFIQPSCGYAIGNWNWESGSATYNENNYEWEGTKFRDNLQGATVAYSLKRVNSEIILTEDVTTADNSKHFRHYFVYADANATEDLKIVFGADAAELTITDVTPANVIKDSEVLLGTLIGTLNNAKGDLKKQPFQTFPLAANGSLTLHFKNYTNRMQIWNNFVVEITDNTHFVDLRGDGAGWQWAENWGEYTQWWNESWRTKTGYPATDYEYMKAMDGADVVATVTRSGATFTISASITPVSGSSFSEEYTFTDDNLKSTTVYVNLLCEGGHLDLLPVTKTITSAGWATYCSPYALNLAGASATLEDAYIVTGGNDGVLTLTSVKDGTVPANTGLLLKGSEGTVTIPIVGSGTTDVSTNILEGVLDNTAIEQNIGWVLMGSPVGFYQNANAFTVGANTAYIPVAKLPVPAGARSFYSFGDATAIKAIDNSSTSEAAKPSAQFAIDNYYNVAGQRVAALTKGLYIKNGKKIVVK